LRQVLSRIASGGYANGYVREGAAPQYRARLDPDQSCTSPGEIVSDATFQLGAKSMPTDTIILVSAIVVMFVIFAAVLAWTDHYAHGYRPEG